MYVPHALRILSAGALLALIATLAVGGARAAQNVHPAEAPASIGSLRALVDHYRVVTWRYQAAAKLHRTPTSYSYRRSSDRAYLRWTIDRWTRLAYVAREHTLTRIHRRLDVNLPAAPAHLHPHPDAEAAQDLPRHRDPLVRERPGLERPCDAAPLAGAERDRGLRRRRPRPAASRSNTPGLAAAGVPLHSQLR